MTKEYRHIGKESPRLSARAFVTGKSKYIRDIKRPRMLYGKVLRSPYPHANIKSIDTSKAEKLRGVKAVLTYENTPDWYFGMPIRNVRILENKVRYVGDGVALVAAETEQIAEEALDLIDVEYEALPAVYDIDEAMKPGAPQLYADFPGNLIPNELTIKRLRHGLDIDIGDTEKGFEEADIIVEGTARLESGQNPLPPEAPAVIAEWEEGKLTEWGSFSSPGLTVHPARAVMRLEEGNLRLIAADVGGSYGSKHGDLRTMAYAAALAGATRRPVGLFYTKEEHFASFQVRMGSRAYYKIGMKKDGTVTAITGEWICNCGASPGEQGLMLSVGLEVFPVLARCPNLKVETKTALTNTIISGSYRGFGYLENTTLLSPVLSIAMEKANLDPVEYYKKNCMKPGDKFYHPYMGLGWQVCAGPDITRAIEKGAELFRWKNKWKGWGKPTESNGTTKKGIGIGVAGQTDTGEQASNGNVQLNAFGTVTLYCCITEFGTGARDVIRKIAAEALDVPLESVSITPPDTLVNPWDWGSTGSRSTYALGSTIFEAVEDAKRKLFRQSAPMLQAKPEDLETKDGMVYVRANSEKRLPWRAIMGWQGAITGEGHFPGSYNVPAYQIHFVEVEVDVETGEAKLLSLVSATDCGQIIDPLALQGQLQGFSPGVDLALREESVVDKATGHMLNPNMIDYKWRVFPELPTHQFVILETPPNADPPCPFGAFGVGEPSLAPATPAISMAIYNAIGKRFLEYPITPEKILKALGKL
jgi:xanthine dehydrogenase molybdenum-binding subunit